MLFISLCAFDIWGHFLKTYQQAGLRIRIHTLLELKVMDPILNLGSELFACKIQQDRQFYFKQKFRDVRQVWNFFYSPYASIFSRATVSLFYGWTPPTCTCRCPPCWRWWWWAAWGGSGPRRTPADPPASTWRFWNSRRLRYKNNKGYQTSISYFGNNSKNCVST